MLLLLLPPHLQLLMSKGLKEAQLDAGGELKSSGRAHSEEEEEEEERRREHLQKHPSRTTQAADLRSALLPLTRRCVPSLTQTIQEARGGGGGERRGEEVG